MCDWRKDSVFHASHFIKTVSGKANTVAEQIKAYDRLLVESNRKKTGAYYFVYIIFAYEGNFEDLIKFKVESGNKILEDHLNSCRKKCQIHIPHVSK